jgi:hypothetical protein
MLALTAYKKILTLRQVGVSTLLTRLKQSIASARVCCTKTPRQKPCLLTQTTGLCRIPQEAILTRGRTRPRAQEAMSQHIRVVSKARQPAGILLAQL